MHKHLMKSMIAENEIRCTCILSLNVVVNGYQLLWSDGQDLYEYQMGTFILFICIYQNALKFRYS